MKQPLLYAASYHQAPEEDPRYPHYCIAGSCPFLRQEMVGFLQQPEQITQRLHIELNAQLDWEALSTTLRSPSLFQPNLQCVLQLPEKRLNKTQAQALCALQPLLAKNVTLVLVSPQSVSRLTQETWWSRFAPQMRLVQCDYPDAATLTRWIQQRAMLKGIRMTLPVCKQLQAHYNQDMAAIAEALQQGPPWDMTQAATAIHKLVTPAEWIDAILAQHADHATALLQALKRQQTAPLLLMRALQPYLLSLLAMQQISCPAARAKVLLHLNATRFDRRLRKSTDRTLSCLNQALILLQHLEVSIKSGTPLQAWAILEICGTLLAATAPPRSARGRGIHCH